MASAGSPRHGSASWLSSFGLPRESRPYGRAPLTMGDAQLAIL
jgi:hypothetical protein